MARVRSKHSNLFNYFIHDRRDLSPAYVRSCEKFFIDLKIKKALKDGAYKRWKKLLKQKASSLKPQASSRKLQAALKKTQS